jgi:hypothetical protein
MPSGKRKLTSMALKRETYVNEKEIAEHNMQYGFFPVRNTTVVHNVIELSEEEFKEYTR